MVVATAASLSLSGPLAGSARAGVHVVRQGQTLSAIAHRYKISVTRLVRVNRVANPNLIVVGQRLRVPGKGRSVARVHVVRAGETLSGIAAHHGTSAAALARRNRLRDPNHIVVGQRLRVPGSGGGGAPAQRAPSPGRTSVGASLERQARVHGVSVALVKALAWQESGWNQRAVSSAGAVGVMQVMPATARYVNQVLGGGHLDIRTMDDNVHLGVMYLHHLLGMMRSERRALAAYYAGPGNVGRRLSPGQRHYADNVQALKARFG
ncbi:MAG: LysM peptidoglycan-binding domain-containing protein [Actinomycetota bacterium]